MTPPPTSIDGTDITGATIDGQEVQEITIDGDTVFTAGPPGGLVAFYEFEGTLTDSVGSNDLTNNGNGIFSNTPRFGSQSKFYDGSDDFDSIPTNLVSEAGPYTISAFFRTQDDQSDIFSQGNSSSITPFIRLIVEDGVVKLTIRGPGSDQTRLAGSITVSDGVYHHAVGTFDGSTMQVFTDGGDKQTRTYTKPIPDTNQSAFGALFRPSAALFFSGRIDHAKIYDRVLTDQEIANLSSTGSI